MAVVNALEWQPVASTVFASAAYRREARQLYVSFHSGAIYRYFDCPAEVYEDFIAAESKGRYFAACVRGKFCHQRVRCARRGAQVVRDQRRAAAHAAGVYSPIR
jgi:hypothetical protein